MTRKLSRGEFFARQKADAWAHAQNPELANREREARDIRERWLAGENGLGDMHPSFRARRKQP
jgi:hypothetical protein